MASPVWVRMLALASCLALGAYAQGTVDAPADTKTYAFDVVSIKPNRSGPGSTSIDRNPNRFSANNVSVKTLVLMAYGLKMEDQISGMPGWANSAGFDIEAKVDVETMAALKAMPEEAKEAASDAMLAAMLADRFQLKVHHETRDLPIYSLLVAKGGSKLKEAAPEAKNNGSMSQHNQSLTATGIPISQVCTFLSRQTHRKVEDKTGLPGIYDLTLQWAPDEAAGEAPKDAAGNALPSLFTAIQEQLGLRLESAKGPVDTIVIDRIAQSAED